MLTLLKIRNLALVDRLAWDLGSGLIAITGETGAGKSVIVGALKMILGERADKGIIRTGEETCGVEAVFELPNISAINTILEDGGLEPCTDPQIIIRRNIGTSTNRQFINDSPVTLGLLKKVGERLVDLHGPHDHQSLLSQERQLAMLDAFSATEKNLGEYQESFRIWREQIRKLEEITKAEVANEQELELLRYQLEEIQGAKISETDGDELQEKYQRITNSSRLVELSAQALAKLNDDNAIQERISTLQKIARDLEKYDPSISEKLAPLETAVLELQELEANLSDYVENLESDPDEAENIEERINIIETLKRKYGPTLQDIIARGAEVADRLDHIENRSEKIEALTANVATAREKVESNGKKLSASRKRSAPKLAKDIAGQLKELGFKQSSFEIQLTTASQPTSHGLEDCNFLFGPNPGEPLHPLRQIASSGEISRVMLAVKSSLAEQDATPLMVFDEIDANVGGEIARAVGKKMARLGKLHQVISITHFPQVAATADAHFVVEKEVAGGRTRSHLYPVVGDQRVDELVRMLGGGNGPQARDMAASLLEL